MGCNQGNNNTERPCRKIFFFKLVTLNPYNTFFFKRIWKIIFGKINIYCVSHILHNILLIEILKLKNENRVV